MANNKEKEKASVFFSFHDISRKNTDGKNAMPTRDNPLKIPLKYAIHKE